MSYKVVMVGHNSVGKTSLAVRFVEGVFTHQEATIGAAFFAKSVLVKEDTGGKSTNRDAKITQKLVRMEIWDTAGQERYRSLAPIYYRGAHGAIVTYDVTNPKSFQVAKFWVQELQGCLGSVVMILVGNKVDKIVSEEDKLQYQNRNHLVPKKEASEYAKQHGVLFMETSAKSGLFVKEMFLTMAKELSNRIPLKTTSSSSLLGHGQAWEGGGGVDSSGVKAGSCC